MSEPSLRFTMVHRSGGLTTSRTEYICGRNTRMESRSCTGRTAAGSPTGVQCEYGPLRAYIRNRDLGYGFDLDLEERIYTAFQTNEYGSPIWLKPRLGQPYKRTGKTVHIHTETVDTGERREIFGYPARHVIVRRHQIRDSQLLSESECDGWYIDPPAAWLTLHPVKPGTFCHVILGVLGHERDEYKFSATGHRETGFMVQASQVNRSPLSDETGSLKTHENVSYQEIIEFSETPLQPQLFVPPPSFRRVLQLPNAMRYPLARRARLRWEMLKDSFSLRDNIAEFTALHSRS